MQQPRTIYIEHMCGKTLWASLSDAAEFIDVSSDTILRRGVEFKGNPSEIHLSTCQDGKIRHMKLKLGVNTRQERRYYVPDLMHWLK